MWRAKHPDSEGKAVHAFAAGLSFLRSLSLSLASTWKVPTPLKDPSWPPAAPMMKQGLPQMRFPDLDPEHHSRGVDTIEMQGLQNLSLRCQNANDFKTHDDR